MDSQSEVLLEIVTNDTILCGHNHFQYEVGPEQSSAVIGNGASTGQVTCQCTNT